MFLFENELSPAALRTGASKLPFSHNITYSLSWEHWLRKIPVYFSFLVSIAALEHKVYLLYYALHKSINTNITRSVFSQEFNLHFMNSHEIKKIVLQRGEIFPFLLFAPHNEHNEKSLSSQGKKLLKRIGEKIHLINWKGWLFATAWNFPFLSVSHPIQFSLMSKENTFIHPIQSINENNTRRNTLNTWLGKKTWKNSLVFYLTGLVNLLNWQWQKDRYYYKSTQKWNSTQGPIKEKCFDARVSLPFVFYFNSLPLHFIQISLIWSTTRLSFLHQIQ